MTDILDLRLPKIRVPARITPKASKSVTARKETVRASTASAVEKKPKRAPPANGLNDLTAKEWIPETVSVWTQRGLGKGHSHAQIEKQHPAPFSFQDVARVIKFFTKKGEAVLDPFVGVG